MQIPSTRTHLLQRLILAATIATLPAYASAQSGALEEVIVTATKRTQSIQDVSMTVTAFSEQDIQDANIGNASDVAILTPSLTVTGNLNPFNTNFRIRGIGTAQNDVALEPSVGIFVDDVFLSRSGLGMSDLTDIERIEVLHGPQGTLYGKNTNAGAVSIFTKDSRGRRPVHGDNPTFQQDPYWRDLLLFYEYFHGDKGAGIGASHQTGWTGLVAELIRNPS